MKKIPLFTVVILILVGCGENQFHQTNATYGSGYFYGIEPLMSFDKSLHVHMYAVQDSTTGADILAEDLGGNNLNQFKAVKEIYAKEDPAKWRQRPVLVHYQKIYRRWWPGTAADSTKGNINSSVQCLVTGFSYVPVKK